LEAKSGFWMWFLGSVLRRKLSRFWEILTDRTLLGLGFRDGSVPIWARKVTQKSTSFWCFLWVFAGSVWVLGGFRKPSGHSIWAGDLGLGRFCAEMCVFEEFSRWFWAGPGSSLGQKYEAE
jgi:hypothetical protein